MLERNAYRYKLKTTIEQEAALRRWTGAGRWVFNQALELQKRRLDEGFYVQSYPQMCDQLGRWKQTAEHSWLAEPNQQALQQRLKDLAKAFADFFDPEQPNKCLPQFKKKGKDDTLRFPQGVEVKCRKVYLPKLGWVRFFRSRSPEGTIKNATVRREADGWYVSIQTEREVQDPVHPSSSIVGGDLGVRTFLALSDEQSYPAVRAMRDQQSKLTHLQRQLLRKEKFSANWKKGKAKIAKLHQKIARVRRDALDKLSTDLAKNHAVVVLEDLKVANMTACATGTVESPGKNVKQKAGLNRAILDQGWSRFARMLEYKLSRRGGTLLKVRAHYTSQQCSECGYVEEANRKTVDLFICKRCGHMKNAHTQAAENILARGLQDLEEQHSHIARQIQPPGDMPARATVAAVPVEACGGIGCRAPEGALPREAGTRRNRKGVASGVQGLWNTPPEGRGRMSK